MGVRVAGLVALVVFVLAVSVGGCATTTREGVAAEPIRAVSSAVIRKDGSDEPKVVIELYEDFLCPACRRFEGDFGFAVHQLIDRGWAAVDYYMVAILDRPSNDDYSSRASAAAYCVADDDSSNREAFQRFKAALFTRQPDEAGPTFPDDDQLIETARQAGPVVGECVKAGRYLEMARGLAAAKAVTSTPTVRINGEDYEFSTPAALIAHVEKLLR